MTRVSTTVLTIVLGIRGMSKREIRTRASTSVLTRVLCVDRVSKGHEKTTIRTRASTGVLARVLRIDRMLKGHGKRDNQDTGEHRRARSCPACPRDVEGTWKKGCTGHGRALACSLVSCVLTEC